LLFPVIVVVPVLLNTSSLALKPALVVIAIAPLRLLWLKVTTSPDPGTAPEPPVFGSVDQLVAVCHNPPPGVFHHWSARSVPVSLNPSRSKLPSMKRKYDRSRLDPVRVGVEEDVSSNHGVGGRFMARSSWESR